MARIVSDGVNHKVYDDYGNTMQNVVEVKVSPLSHGVAAKAVVTFVNVKLDLTADSQFVEGKL
jgi:hypothetical protein